MGSRAFALPADRHVPQGERLRLRGGLSLLRGREEVGLLFALSLAAAATLGACTGGTDESEANDDGEPFDDDGGTEAVHEAGPQTCFAPAGLEQPRTITDVVAILNALPKPVSVACLLQTLPRPLSIEASTDQSSFQPAFGPASPRIIIHVGELVVTVVPEGKGSTVVEMSEARPGGRSTKAELPFPIVGDVLPEDPFLRVQDSGEASQCSICHVNEVRDNAIDFVEAFTSAALRPLPRFALPAEDVAYQYGRCDPLEQPERCAILDGVFGYGDVVDYVAP